MPVSQFAVNVARRCIRFTRRLARVTHSPSPDPGSGYVARVPRDPTARRRRSEANVHWAQLKGGTRAPNPLPSAGDRRLTLLGSRARLEPGGWRGRGSPVEPDGTRRKRRGLDGSGRRRAWRGRPSPIAHRGHRASPNTIRPTPLRPSHSALPLDPSRPLLLPHTRAHPASLTIPAPIAHPIPLRLWTHPDLFPLFPSSRSKVPS